MQSQMEKMKHTHQDQVLQWKKKSQEAAVALELGHKISYEQLKAQQAEDLAELGHEVFFYYLLFFSL